MSTTYDTKAIAQNIMSQIGMRNFMCYGVPRGTIIALSTTNERIGGLQFNFTNCRVHRNGKVLVELMNNDEYKVSVYNQLGNLKYQMDGIYADNLAEVINDNVGAY
jgi:hypothetical protein